VAFELVLGELLWKRSPLVGKASKVREPGTRRGMTSMIF
jgi:hypothetical protein